MAMDNRDWYRDLWRKKTGYVERSDFRSPVNQPPVQPPEIKPPPTPYPYGRMQRQQREHRRAWLYNFIKLALLLAAVFVAIALMKR